MYGKLQLLAAVGGLLAAVPFTAIAQSSSNHVFGMTVSSGAATCLSHASGRVTVTETTGGQHLHVEVSGLPRNTNFDFFLIQVPKAPFGMAWYQGDINTDFNGVGVGDFAGIFSRETFVVAPGSAPNKVIFSGDASSNPATRPIHTHHLGLWFNSPSDATKAGCPGSVTPFNGEHNAGIQVLNTATFSDTAGPLQSTK